MLIMPFIDRFCCCGMCKQCITVVSLYKHIFIFRQKYHRTSRRNGKSSGNLNLIFSFNVVIKRCMHRGVDYLVPGIDIGIRNFRQLKGDFI